MKRTIFLSLLSIYLLSPINIGAGELLKFLDPAGDDKGPGTYTYPTDPVYVKGSFDILSFEVEDKGKDIIFKVMVNALIEDPWDSKSWGGNGFSIQMVQIYIDTDKKEGSGIKEALPGINAVFQSSSFWEKVVIISPQGRSRLISEINQKAGKVKDRIVIPKSTRAQGRYLLATVSKAEIGENLESYGYQVVMQSNEGFPAKEDLLTRKVNEYEGPHRFGGGTDYDCDPHILDIIVAPAKGGEDEKKKQYSILSAYKCSDDPSGYILAALPMVSK